MKPDIIACARGYIGTPFHHQGRLKGKGIDCLGLLVCVARELQLTGKDGSYFADADITHYSHQPDTEVLRATLDRLLYPIPVSGIKESDIALFNIDNMPQHMGIVTNIGLIHAYAPARKVVEHALDAYWHSKLVAGYRVQL